MHHSPTSPRAASPAGSVRAPSPAGSVRARSTSPDVGGGSTAHRAGTSHAEGDEPGGSSSGAGRRIRNPNSSAFDEE